MSVTLTYRTPADGVWLRETSEESGRGKKEEGRGGGNFVICHFCNRTRARFERKWVAAESEKPVGCGWDLLLLTSHLLPVPGTTFRADRGFTSPTNSPISLRISPNPLTSPIPLPFFLLRPRKRAKKKGAARRGAGFSVNHLRDTNGNWVPCKPATCTCTTVLDGIARKNPPSPPPVARGIERWRRRSDPNSTLCGCV